MGEKFMIKKFSVKNFKNFENILEVDFSRKRDYEFNQYLIKNGLINKMLIYGPNNSGKSNLGAAIMDITRHLTDNRNDNLLYAYYLNGNGVEQYVEFKYDFLFGTQEISYSYRKNINSLLLYEDLVINGKYIYKYNYENDSFENKIAEASTIDLKKRNRDMSVLKFIYANTMYWPEDSPVKLVIEFANNMLWFRSLKQNEFMGLMANGEDLNDFIINNKLIKDFEQFLKNSGQNYHLCEMIETGRKIIGVKFNKYIARFDIVASTGTKSLWLFYYWMNRSKDISFIYLDEFDAFYHTKLSKYILNYVNKKECFQSILTTHNTYLADNELMRPDCYAILNDGILKSFADRTNKTIRQAHNLEKMMLGGEFEE